jgi:hypothetical protein
MKKIEISIKDGLPAIDVKVSRTAHVLVMEPSSCECDNTHGTNDTVCRYCWANGRRKWNDPAVSA